MTQLRRSLVRRFPLHSAGMTDYSRMKKAELIERLKALEAGMASKARHPGHARVLERELAEAAEKDNEERLRAILDTAVEGIITIDERGIVESANPAAERLFGYPAAEMIGQNVSRLMPSPYREEHDGYLANYQRTGKAQIIGIGREVVGQRKDGTVFPMDLSVGEVRLAGRRLFTGIVRDITTRKRLEQEILEVSGREQRRIGQDLHDGLCQQLAGIELMCQVLQQELSGKAQRQSARAADIARHVREAIGQTRSLARGLSPVDLDSDGLMSALRELALNVGKLFQVECCFRCDEPIHIHSNAVASHLYRIAQEAINNAVKHGKATRILVTLKLANGDACLTVADDGAGIPANLPNTEGMGLRIMQFRAGVIGAKLEIRRANGKGTVVTCTFKRNL